MTSDDELPIGSHCWYEGQYASKPIVVRVVEVQEWSHSVGINAWRVTRPGSSVVFSAPYWTLEPLSPLEELARITDD